VNELYTKRIALRFSLFCLFHVFRIPWLQYHIRRRLNQTEDLNRNSSAGKDSGIIGYIFHNFSLLEEH
jgi:hypothetical protein